MIAAFGIIPPCKRPLVLSTSARNGRLQSGTIPEPAIIQLDLLKMSMMMLKTCRGS
jgi:hypothetical protein